MERTPGSELRTKAFVKEKEHLQEQAMNFEYFLVYSNTSAFVRPSGIQALPLPVASIIMIV